MLERAIMLKARVSLLPPGVPSHDLLDLAVRSGHQSWAASVHSVQLRLDSDHPVPDIIDTMSDEDVTLARSSKPERTRFLKQYKLLYVAPACQRYDDAAFTKACDKSSWPYHAFQHGLDQLPAVLFELDLGPCTNRFYCAWSVARLLGR